TTPTARGAAPSLLRAPKTTPWFFCPAGWRPSSSPPLGAARNTGRTRGPPRRKPPATVLAAIPRPRCSQAVSSRSVGRWLAYLSNRISTHTEVPRRLLGISLGGSGAVRVWQPAQGQVA